MDLHISVNEIKPFSVSGISNGNYLFDTTPEVQEVSTPVPSNMVTKENDTLNETTCTDDCDDSPNGEVNLISPIWGKYVSKKDFLHKNNTNDQEVLQVLKQIRVKNIGHLNVNFFSKKLDAIKTIIPSDVDIMVFSETMLDSSYPIAQLLIEFFGKPFRLDRNAFGGGILIYVRSDIPCQQVN